VPLRTLYACEYSRTPAALTPASPRAASAPAVRRVATRRRREASQQCAVTTRHAPLHRVGRLQQGGDILENALMGLAGGLTGAFGIRCAREFVPALQAFSPCVSVY
jgi:hypothetical protein